MPETMAMIDDYDDHDNGDDEEDESGDVISDDGKDEMI